MDGEQPSPSSSALYIGGAGGKFMKPPSRKKSATPYDRPVTANQPPQRRQSGWLSKLVDPACRLIAGGATRILPSFFSRSPSALDLTSSDNNDLSLRETDNRGTDATKNASNDDIRALCLELSKKSGEAGPSTVTDKLKENTEYDECEQNDTRNLCDDSELTKIEELVKGKVFSRDEINRLTEILKSRLVDSGDVDQGKKEPSLNMVGEAKMSVLPNDSPLKLVAGKQENMNGDILGTSPPGFHLKIHDEVAASPADIARAYMGSRTLDSGLGMYNIRSKSSTGERSLQQGDELALRPFIPSSSPKPSTCWPGSMVQDQRGYTTPQTPRGKFSLHNLPRTPYSRTIFSKSKGKLSQLHSDSRSISTSSTPFYQPRTPIYGQAKSRVDVENDSYRSVGPIRRVRNKFGSETRPGESTSLYSIRSSPPEAETKGFLARTEKNTEHAGTSSTLKYDSVDNTAQDNSPSNETVRKILEQLDRHKPTPKEIEAELKIATSWKKSPPEGNEFIPKENRFDFNKIPAEGNAERGYLNFYSKTSNTDASKAPGVVFTDHSLINDTNTGPSGVKKTSPSSITNTEKDLSITNSVPKDTSQLWPFQSQPNNGNNLGTMPAPSGPRPIPLYKPPVGNKTSLKNISINKPDPRQIVPSENGLGFTFPISNTSSVLSEPPTPSVMPSFSASGPKEEPVVPTYSFGSKKSTPRLVFSFPSTSDATKSDVKVSDIKFKFGSEKNRVSFSSVGKDAICF